jgi:hypothetical protein
VPKIASASFLVGEHPLELHQTLGQILQQDDCDSSDEKDSIKKKKAARFRDLDIVGF